MNDLLPEAIMADDEEDDLLPASLPPIPLVSGDTVPGPSGGEVAVARVELVVTAKDGSRRVIALRHQHGAWWAPRPGPIA